MKTLLFLLTLCFASCSTPATSGSPEGNTVTAAVAQTAAYFGTAEILFQAKTESDFKDKQDIARGLVLLLRGFNGRVVDPVEVRDVLSRYTAGKPPHWAALTQIFVVYLQRNATEEGKNAVLNSVISGIEAAVSTTYRAA